MTRRLLFVFFILLSIVFYACKKDKVVPYVEDLYEEGEELSIGSATIYDESDLAFSYQVKGLNQSEKLLFFVGNSFFKDIWVEAPSSTTARDGLGPLFNARACAACHFKDGRGEPIKDKGILFRISKPGNSVYGPIADYIYGGQLQDNAISNIPNEGEMDIQYNYIQDIFPDGTIYTLRQPLYAIIQENYGSISSDLLISARVGQQVIGLGFLEIISESDILKNADENDANGDGISGRPNYVWDPVSQTTRVGRFGWKANVANLYTQVAGAFNGDIGITTNLFPNENHTDNQTACQGLPNGGSPEISDEDLEKVVLYMQTLAVPVRRNYTQTNVLQGKSLFNSINCNLCHTPKFVTSNSGSINALKNVTIRPYSDMLLHDMGEGLSDNRSDFNATGREWRTQPLWGLGLINRVNGHTNLLHDGRAQSIEEAILWHGGEAQESKEMYMNSSAEDRKKILLFLESL